MVGVFKGEHTGITVNFDTELLTIGAVNDIAAAHHRE